MPEYEIYGKVVSGPFIKSESNAVELFNMLEINKAAIATFRYEHPFPDVGKGNLKINIPNYSFSVEYFGDNPFEIERMFNPEHFQTVELETEPSRILDKKKKLGLKEKGYKFTGFEYHPPRFEAGIHISANRSKKETVAFVSAKAQNYDDMDKFENAMEKLGFTDLKKETKKHKVVSISEFLGI